MVSRVDFVYNKQARDRLAVVGLGVPHGIEWPLDSKIAGRSAAWQMGHCAAVYPRQPNRMALGKHD